LDNFGTHFGSPRSHLPFISRMFKTNTSVLFLKHIKQSVFLRNLLKSSPVEIHDIVHVEIQDIAPVEIQDCTPPRHAPELRLRYGILPWLSGSPNLRAPQIGAGTVPNHPRIHVHTRAQDSIAITACLFCLVFPLRMHSAGRYTKKQCYWHTGTEAETSGSHLHKGSTCLC
jgi:hypothetical protein